MNEVPEEQSPIASKVRISPSSLSLLDQCPKKWFHKYIEKKEEPAGEAALVGSFIHEVLENFYLFNASYRTEQTLRSVTGSMWDEFWEKLNTESTTSLSEKELKIEVWRIMKGLWEFEEPESVKVHSVEIELNAHYKGVRFKGFVDRIEMEDGHLLVVDYKTGAAPRADYAVPKLMQLLLYCWALDQMDIHADRARLLYVKERKIIQADITSETRKATVKYLDKSLSKLEQYFDEDLFPPKPGPLCGWCPFITECPSGMNTFWFFANSGRMKRTAPAFELLADFIGANEENSYTDEDDFKNSFGQF